MLAARRRRDLDDAMFAMPPPRCPPTPLPPSGNPYPLSSRGACYLWLCAFSRRCVHPLVASSRCSQSKDSGHSRRRNYFHYFTIFLSVFILCDFKLDIGVIRRWNFFRFTILLSLKTAFHFFHFTILPYRRIFVCACSSTLSPCDGMSFVFYDFALFDDLSHYFRSNDSR